MPTRSPLFLCAALTLAVASLAGCQQTARSRGLGRVPTSLVDLYDQAKVDGGIELEIDRDGTIREMEADIPVSALPATVRDAALARAAGAQITGAEREIQRGGDMVYEVKLHHSGRDWELVMDAAGAIFETERELDASEAPRAVLATAESAVPGSALASVEIIESANTTEYHVKRTRDGASYKMVIAPDGRLLRKVREHRAEIEIPVVD